ncbi:Hypothetical protein A7982_02964 [Minicystis rosea]|nr:Hypothetical protein A7982_02964 [Minicystis rosea]
MRIRLWTAFASNNSGSYTIVGSFKSAETARAVAEELDAIVSEHDAFMETPEEERVGLEPPFHRFVRAHGLTLESDRLALDDDWPASWSSPPEVTLAGTQVLVHAPYTVTMPRTFGELFYRRGGRVDVELDHAHEPVIAHFSFWVAGGSQRREAADESLAALQRTLATEVLPPLLVDPTNVARPPIEPAWAHDAWGALDLGVVFQDLAYGVAEVTRVARDHGVALRLRVSEALHGGADPLASMRGGDARAPGTWQAVLWDAKDAGVSALKVLREITGLPLAEARERLADLPCVVLDAASRDDAVAVAEKLCAIGADAEAVRITAR